MKLFARTATGLILSAPFLLRAFALSGAPEASAYPFRRPVTLDSLQAQGHLRVAVSSDLARALTHPSDRADFDYDLLNRFASDLRVRLERRDVDSSADAARLLDSGIADLAVLPLPSGNGFFPTRGACPMGEAADADATADAGNLVLFARTDSPELIRALDGALPKLAQAANSAGLYERYCVDHKALAEADQVVPWGGQASRYSRLIAKYAREEGLDWRLVAAVISEESGFQVHAVSSKGATGLMQLMPGVPGTDIANPFDPEPNIRAGVLYLRRLQDMFRHDGRSDDLALVLAAYLVGPGHVLDAQTIARGLGLDPNRWRGGLDHVLPLLELEQFFPKTRCGFARGQQAVGYVNRILERYDLYKRHMDARPADQTAAVEAAPARHGSA